MCPTIFHKNFISAIHFNFTFLFDNVHVSESHVSIGKAITLKIIVKRILIKFSVCGYGKSALKLSGVFKFGFYRFSTCSRTV